MKKDIVTLRIPAQPEYLLVVRLTAAGLANRMGFNVEEIEDVKAAVAEACIMLMNQPWVIDDITLDFEITSEVFHATVQAQGKASETDEEPENDNDLSRYLLQALMDDATVGSENGFIHSISIQKRASL
ncbi:MAG: ATP-binding protein [Bacillota bacterium]